MSRHDVSCCVQSRRWWHANFPVALAVSTLLAFLVLALMLLLAGQPAGDVQALRAASRSTHPRIVQRAQPFVLQKKPQNQKRHEMRNAHNSTYHEDLEMKSELHTTTKEVHKAPHATNPEGLRRGRATPLPMLSPPPPLSPSALSPSALLAYHGKWWWKKNKRLPPPSTLPRLPTQPTGMRDSLEGKATQQSELPSRFLHHAVMATAHAKLSMSAECYMHPVNSHISTSDSTVLHHASSERGLCNNVHLLQQISSAPCINGFTYGLLSVDALNESIWVDCGCRGVFSCCHNMVFCRSADGKRHSCKCKHRRVFQWINTSNNNYEQP
mmetsp:Transcript_6273/g.10587  ORF Transcript_6273/g.10587 Transcript_6273/m.10587 type:complete len:326 (-) Transcript_6273:296-1273(-)